MSTTVRSQRVPVLPEIDTRLGAPGQPTPLPTEFPFLRPPQVPGELGRLGNYRVFKLLGSGGMGKVFLAEDLALKRDVALKVMCLPPGEDLLSWRERFLREARAQAAIRHPNLVSVYQVGEDRGTVYLAMELLEGETLESRIRSEGQLDVSVILRVGEEVAEGLAAIHARGLIHRDIKPGNIWLSQLRNADCGLRNEGTEEEDASTQSAIPCVKILDFGLVREVESDTQLTESGAVVGTPAYMSPEQARGRALDHRSDLFSFGCVLYAMCTGRAPFVSSNPMAQAAALVADEPVRVRKLNPNVPRALSQLVSDLLAKAPEDRPQSATEVLGRLRAVCESDADDQSHQPKARSFYRRHAIKFVVLVWLVLAALVVAELTRGNRSAEEKLEPVPGVPAPTVPVTYLRELRKVEDRVFPPAGAPRPPGEDAGVRVSGKHSPHGIFMHGSPGHTPPAFASYALDKRFSRFTADVALNDSAGKWTGVIFVVIADDKLVWSSGNISRAEQKETCDIDVTGVRVLRLEVRTMGPPQGAHGAWIEPRLTP